LTGKRLTGEKVPGWNDLRSLAVQLLLGLSRHSECGWVLALTDDGPIAEHVRIPLTVKPDVSSRMGAMMKNRF
jgi:hypothetical protein